jgi:hypothetical protein
VIFWQLVLDVFEPAAELERCNSLFFLSSSSSGSDNDSAVAVPAIPPRRRRAQDHPDDEEQGICTLLQGEEEGIYVPDQLNNLADSLD